MCPLQVNLLSYSFPHLYGGDNGDDDSPYLTGC